MAATLLLPSGGMIAFALTPWLPLAYLLLAIARFGYLASNSHATSRLQFEVEERQRGRIMALWSVAFLRLRPIAASLMAQSRRREACAYRRQEFMQILNHPDRRVLDPSKRRSNEVRGCVVDPEVAGFDVTSETVGASEVTRDDSRRLRRDR
jgi:hypothetical protein